MKLPSLSFLLQALLAVIERFPATMLCAVTGVGAVMTAIENNGGDNSIKLWMMAQIGLALCTGLVVFAESRGWKPAFRWGLQAAGLGLLAVYYFLLDIDAPAMEKIHLPRYLGFLALAHLIAAFAPYLNQWRIADFWEYNKQLFANFVIGGVYTLILFSGLSLAVLAVNELFDLHIDEKIYAHLFALLAGVFNTAFFLFHLPRNFAFDERGAAYNTVFKNLCQYILIPIVGLYFLILYAYSIKILVTWTLPKGWVSSLVLGFSVAGIFTYLINYRLIEYTDSKTVHAYRRWFWWVLLPMIGLLFVAISRRIADYGITEERYFIAHAGLWLLAVCLYFLWSKSDNIKFIPISLGIFVLVAVLGPLSAFEVSQRSQSSILHRLLAESGRFDGDKLKQSKAPVPDSTAGRIQSCLAFLEDRDALSRIESWFPEPLQSIAPGPSAAHYHRRTDTIAAWLGVGNGAAHGKQPMILSVRPASDRQMHGDISGFGNFYRIELYQHSMRRDKKTQVFLSDSGKALILMDAANKTVADSFDLAPQMRQWAALGSIEYILPDSAQAIDLPGKKTAARLFVYNFRFDRTEMKMQSLSGMLFLK